MNEINKNNFIPAFEQIIKHTLFENKTLSKELEQTFKHNKFFDDIKIRSLFINDIYDLIRYWRLWCAAAGIENHMSTNLEIRKVIFAWATCRNNNYYNNVSENTQTDILGKYVVAKTENEESVPDWINELGKNDYGDEWKNILHELNKNSKIHVRTNTLRTTTSNLVSEFAKNKIDATEFQETKDALFVTTYKNLFETPQFKNGHFEFQDVSSQQVSIFCNVTPGMRVIDACAGAGGKSLHLATLMNNRGKIIALDIHKWKLDELKKRMVRNGISIIEPRTIESSKTIKRLHHSADLVLLDIPCSGSGVWRRNPDMKWKLEKDGYNRLIDLQKELLEKYSLMVKPEGILVYATCSIFKGEGEIQIQNFLTKKGSEWDFVKEKRILPEEKNGDGFYMALLKRKK
ncbi:MAG: RsmB/NOP family class I SAM-dependent RNA methyltransferase [Bacteroidetes bacterium]|nr:RsmB/NOP family class I SAM-dependent RNA methyltransferase [Bacteroidota bacterium]